MIGGSATSDRIPSSSSSFSSSPAFNAWLSKCNSAIQPCPIRQIKQTRRIERMFPIHSALETDVRQKSNQSWGWLKWGGKNTVKGEIDSQQGKSSSILRSSDMISYSKVEKGKKEGFFEELKSYLEPIEETEEDKAHKARCEDYIDNLFRKSPMIRFMVKHLNILGCSPLDEDGNVEKIFLTKCENVKGGFMPSSPGQPKNHCGLMICYNLVANQNELESTMAHEMMHWFDHCRFKADWTDLRHVACTEIRASFLSGECRFSAELQRGQGGFRMHRQKCARRRAILSVMSNPDCPDKETAERVVDEVFESCINDTRPFDEVY